MMECAGYEVLRDKPNSLENSQVPIAGITGSH